MICEAAKSNIDKVHKTSFHYDLKNAITRVYVCGFICNLITQGRHVCTTSGICCTNRCSQEKQQEGRQVNTSMDWSV